MEPGSPSFWPLGRPPSRLPQGQRRSARDGEPAPACFFMQFLQRPENRNRKARRHRTHLPQVDLELLGQGLELVLRSRSPGSTTGGALRRARVDKPGVGAMRWPWRPWASPLRLPGFAGSLLRVASGERGGLALSRTAGLGEQPLQLCETQGITLGKARLTLGQAVVQLRERARQCWPREAGEAERSQRPTPCRSWVLRPNMLMHTECPTIRSGSAQVVDPSLSKYPWTNELEYYWSSDAARREGS